MINMNSTSDWIKEAEKEILSNKREYEKWLFTSKSNFKGGDKTKGITTMTYKAPLTSSQYLIMTNPHPEIPFLRVGDIIRQSRITANYYEPTKGNRNRLIPFDIISRYCFEPVEVINNPAAFKCFSIRELVNNTGYISDKGLTLLESLVKHRTDKRPVWDIKTLSAYECTLADSSTEVYMQKLEDIARERMGETEEIKDKDLWDL